MKLSFDMNYDKSTQAFKINLQPRSNFPKEKIMKLSNPMHPGGLEYLGFMSSINNVWKTVQNKVYVQTIFYYLEGENGNFSLKSYKINIYLVYT